MARSSGQEHDAVHSTRTEYLSTAVLSAAAAAKVARGERARAWASESCSFFAILRVVFASFFPTLRVDFPLLTAAAAPVAASMPGKSSLDLGALAGDLGALAGLA